MKSIDAKNLYYKELNQSVKQSFKSGMNKLILKNVMGHRYIGDGISGNQTLIIEGIPGNDLAAYMDGPEIIVKGNTQDAMANTMNNGRIIVHGNAGDTVGYAMRGGEIFIKGNVGYRVGIHMKQYQDKKPVIVIGGKAGDFLGEYMAGGMMVLLGLNLQDEDELVGNYCGTGMHGGSIYLRGDVEDYKLGKEVKLMDVDDNDISLLDPYIRRFCEYFGFDIGFVMDQPFKKLYPYNSRPYGNLYAY